MRIFSIIVLTLVTAGCSSLAGSNHIPDIPVTVSEIQKALGCEFFYAFQNAGPTGNPLAKWGAIIELNLGVKDHINIVPGVGALSAKVGNATLTSTAASATLDDQVTDKNALAYTVALSRFENAKDCPAEHSSDAASGLGLSDFLTGTVQILKSGGHLTSTTILTSAGIASNGTVIGPGTNLPGVVATKEQVPTIRYARTFSVSRKVGGGLSFQMGNVGLSLAGSGAERTRADTDNSITITMGALEVDGTKLIDSFWNQRSVDYDALRSVTPNSIVVVNQPTQ
jgi:hypothetical protein